MVCSVDGPVEQWSVRSVVRWSNGLFERWSGGAMVCSGDGPVEQWSVRAMVRWSNGLFGRWSGGAMVCSVGGPVEQWSVRAMVRWSNGLFGRWSGGAMGRPRIGVVIDGFPCFPYCQGFRLSSFFLPGSLFNISFPVLLKHKVTYTCHLAEWFDSRVIQYQVCN